jgi:hypothetical protein
MPFWRKGRVALVLSLCILLALAARLTIAFHRYHKAKQSFASLQIGASRISVVRKMGKPNYYAGKCGVIHVPSKNCALEYVYSHPFAPLDPEYYIVSFSQDEQVIQANAWYSP